MNNNRRYFNFVDIIWEHADEIITQVKKSWDYVFTYVASKGASNSKEPTYIGAYLLYGLNYLNYHLAQNSSLSKELNRAGFQLKFGGIFVHQNPIVELDNTHPAVMKLHRKRCEIGDLLVIFTFVDKHNTPIVNRAFLSQAKIGNERVKGAQRVLYEQNVKFKFYRPSERNIMNTSCSCAKHGHYCRVFPKGVYPRYIPKSRGLKYLRIYPCSREALLELLNNDCNYPIWLYPWYLCCYPYLRRYPFSLSILGLMVGCDGWEFSPNVTNASKPCGWNSIIHDLLSDTASRIFHLTRGQKKGIKWRRGQYLSYLVSQFNEFRNIDEYFIGDDPFEPKTPEESSFGENSNGVSILLIMIKDENISIKEVNLNENSEH